MAVTITDRRSTVTAATSTTNWTGAGFGLTSVSAEGTTAVAAGITETVGQVYYTQPSGTVNLGTSPGTLVYIYSFNNALQDAWDATPPPHALLLGDGSDRIAFKMAGADRRVFNHMQGVPGSDVNSWQCLVLDTGQAGAMNTAGTTYVVAGSFAGLDFANITQWGSSFDTNSKALGGGYNVAVDIIRYGNDGYRLTAGGSGTEGDFSEIAAADNSTATGAGHGILRELTTGVYGCQGPLTFGNSGAATTCYFQDAGIVLAFENRNISDGKYYLNVEGNSGATNYFVLTGSTISTGGPSVKMDMSGGNINTLTFDTVVFAALRGVILFSANADASGHTVNNCTFQACGKITVGAVDFQNNVVSNSVATDNAVTNTGGADMTGCTISGYEGTADTGALFYNVAADPDGELDDMTFVKGTASTHAIAFGSSTPTTMTLRRIAFSGYTNTIGSTAAPLLLPDTGSDVTWTINAVGCTGLTADGYTKARSGDTVDIVLDPRTITINVRNSAGALITDATEVTLVRASDLTVLHNEENVTDGSTSYQYTYSFDVACYVNVVSTGLYVPKTVDPVTLVNSDLTVDVYLDTDRTYSNP